MVKYTLEVYEEGKELKQYKRRSQVLPRVGDSIYLRERYGNPVDVTGVWFFNIPREGGIKGLLRLIFPKEEIIVRAVDCFDITKKQMKEGKIK